MSRSFEKRLNAMEVASVAGYKTLKMLKRYTHLNAFGLAARLAKSSDVNPTVRLISTRIFCAFAVCES